jgi:hypothetical protein
MSILAETTIPGQDTQGRLGQSSFQDPSKGPDDFVQAPASGWHIGPAAPFFGPFIRAHRTVCAWCSVQISPGIEPVSHGICADDLAKVRAETEARKAARAAMETR